MIVAQKHTKDELFSILANIPDPEIPVLSINEMGILKDIIIQDNSCEIIITPTYSGCPAMGVIEEDIKKILFEYGILNVKVKLVLSPAWTTDWMTDEAKEKLRVYGIAPPLHSSCSNFFAEKQSISCPKCGSQNTLMVSHFGSTACKAMYKCNNCEEPFEYFKCH